MAGSGLGGFEERVPCQYCGDTDCTGLTHMRKIQRKDGSWYWSGREICIHTGKVMTTEGKLRSGLANHLTKRKAILDKGLLKGTTLDDVAVLTWDWTGSAPVVKRRGGTTIVDVVPEYEAEAKYVLDDTPRPFPNFKVYRPLNGTDR